MSFVGDLRTVLREPRFGRLFGTRLVSQAGDGVFQVALASFVLFSPERQATAGKVAGSFALLLLPYSVVGPFAGVWIDRWRRQRILLVGNLVRAALVATLTVLVAAGADGPMFYAAALAVFSVNRFFLSALSASLPHVVKPDHLIMGNSVSTTVGALATTLGGGLGGGVRALAGANDTGSALVMAGAVLLYLGSALLAKPIPDTSLGPSANGNRPSTTAALHYVLLDVRDGARHAWQRRRAARALAAITVHRFGYGIQVLMILLLYRNYFHRSDDTGAGLAGLAAIAAVSALGYLVGAVLSPGATRRWGQERWIAGLLAGGAVVTLAGGLPFRQGPLVVAAFLLGMVAQGGKVTVDTIVQESVDDTFRGRVFSFYDILFNASFVAAAACAAVTLPTSGRSRPVVAAVAVAYLATAAVYAWRSGVLRPGAPRPVSTPERPGPAAEPTRTAPTPPPPG
ncbi:MAG: MFS transporter [Mycobacteriales bacterium]